MNLKPVLLRLQISLLLTKIRINVAISLCIECVRNGMPFKIFYLKIIKNSLFLSVLLVHYNLRRVFYDHLCNIIVLHIQNYQINPEADFLNES